MEKFNYIVGDIHGCFDEYLELENEIFKHSEKNAVKPYIVSVGDLIDRGPDSSSLVKHFKKGMDENTHMVVMGNHELMMLEVLECFAPWNFETSGIRYPQYFSTFREEFERKEKMARYLTWEDYIITLKSLWISQGGFSTLESYNCNPYEIKTWNISDEDLKFMISLPIYWENKDIIVTHALADRFSLENFKNIFEKKDINNFTEEEIENIRKSMNTLVWNREDVLECPDENRVHVSGHTPFKEVKRLENVKCIQIDTSCTYGGKLSSLCYETDEILSIQAKKKYF